VKFSLGCDMGLDMLASIGSAARIECDSQAIQDPIEETTTAGNGSLTSDVGGSARVPASVRDAEGRHGAPRRLQFHATARHDSLGEPISSPSWRVCEDLELKPKSAFIVS